MNNIAIIGGGFTGLSVASHLIRLLRLHKKNAAITVFDAQGLRGKRTFSSDLPDNFKLNHEANNMGAINAFSASPTVEDFYQWLQEKKDQPMEGLEGKTLSQKYHSHNLSNPSEYLPRSIYGHYLEYRLQELLENKSSAFHSFSYHLAEVTNVVRAGKKFKVVSSLFTRTYDTVILCTGFWYHPRDNSHLVYNQKFKGRSPKSSIGIQGSSLTAIEMALSLADKGHKNITLYSRHGRLPKVRGKICSYSPTFLTHKTLDKLQDKFGNIEPTLLLTLLKKELDLAYTKAQKGLYQKNGINWREIIENQNPLQQLREDIQVTESGDEHLWRSVLLSLYPLETQLWRNIHDFKRAKFLEKYSSLLLSFVAPMPLYQAKKLLGYIEKGIIMVKKTSDVTEPSEHFIDGRGPSKNITQNSFLMSLIGSGLIQENPAGGILVNKRMQIIRGNNVIHNLFAVGPHTYGEKPHNSTVFAGDYAESIAWYIVNSLDSTVDLSEHEVVFDEEHLYQNFKQPVLENLGINMICYS